MILINLGQEPVTLRRGDRIAQMVVAPCQQIAWQPSESLEMSARGAGGFGSTGVDGRHGETADGGAP